MEEYNYIRKSNVKKRKISSDKGYKKNKSYSNNHSFSTNRGYRNSVNYRDRTEYENNKNTSNKNIKSRKKTRHHAKHSNNRYKCQTRKLNKKKVVLVIAIPLIIIFLIINKNSPKDGQDVEQVSANNPNQNIEAADENTNSTTQTQSTSSTGTGTTENTSGQNTGSNTSSNTESTSGKVTEGTSSTTDISTDWRIRLANYDNILPEDFEVELADIDSTRQFDARAIKYLKDMINDMKKDGHTSIWVQSSYRSVARQKELYENSINKYLKQGKTQEEAEKLTDEYINKPGSSDHNLGLAVDFNYVDNTFADTDEYKWLLENAENYGFILRYPKDKEDITKIAYESWHWRYVGEEHAKKMNELNMCLEEYVEYLENG